MLKNEPTMSMEQLRLPDSDAIKLERFPAFKAGAVLFAKEYNYPPPTDAVLEALFKQYLKYFDK